jgi:hypothetical protein
VLRAEGFDAVWVKPLPTARLRKRLEQLRAAAAS